MYGTAGQPCLALTQSHSHGTYELINSLSLRTNSIVDATTNFNRRALPYTVCRQIWMTTLDRMFSSSPYGEPNKHQPVVIGILKIAMGIACTFGIFLRSTPAIGSRRTPTTTSFLAASPVPSCSPNQSTRLSHNIRERIVFRRGRVVDQRQSRADTAVTCTQSERGEKRRG